MSHQKKEKMIPLSQAAEISGYTTEHLNLCARKKKLEAFKLGRNWYTTLAALIEFAELNDKKGDKKERIAEYVGSVPAGIILEDEVKSVAFESEKTMPASINRADKEIAGESADDHISFKKLLAQSSLIAFASVFAFVVQSGKISKENMQNFFKKDNSGIFENVGEGFLGSDIKSLVLGEENERDETVEKIPAAYASENFQIKEIKFGGSAGILALTEDMGPLEIENIKGESLKKKDGEEAKILVAWDTNKPAKTKITFSRADGQGEKTFVENFYDRTHAAVFSATELGATYHYQISARDRFGNEKKSETFAVYSGSRQMSIFDVIAKAFGEVFGWISN